MADSDEVQFKSPTTGAVQIVPSEHWDEALKAGYTPVTHKVMYSPNGDRGMVSNNQLAEKMKAGYQTTPQTSFEKERTGGARGVMNALKGMVPPSPTQGRSPFDPKFWLNTDEARFDPFGPGTAYSDLTRPLPKDLPTEVLGAGKTGGNAIYRGASIFGPLAGVNAEQMESASGRGDTSGVATQAGVPAALTIATPLARAIVPSLRAKISQLAYDPIGDVKPGLAEIGDALEHPASIPGKAVKAAASKLFPRPPTYPGAFLPMADEFYANRATDLMKRGTQQAILDRQAAIAARLAARNAPPDWQTPAHEEFQLGSPEYPGPFSPLPNKLPASLRGDPFSPKLPPPRLSPFSPNATPTSTPIGGAQLPPVGSYELPKVVASEQSPYAAPIEAPSAEGVPGSVPKPSGRLVVLPEEARALDQMQQIATKRASEHGMQYAAGMRPAGGGRVPRSPTATMTTEFSGTRQEVPQGNPTPFSSPLKMETDSLGIRWAVSPDGYRVSIPRSVPDTAVETYARQKLAEQAQIYGSMTGER